MGPNRAATEPNRANPQWWLPADAERWSRTPLVVDYETGGVGAERKLPAELERVRYQWDTSLREDLRHIPSDLRRMCGALVDLALTGGAVALALFSSHAFDPPKTCKAASTPAGIAAIAMGGNPCPGHILSTSLWSYAVATIFVVLLPALLVSASIGKLLFDTRIALQSDERQRAGGLSFIRSLWNASFGLVLLPVDVVLVLFTKRKRRIIDHLLGTQVARR